MPRYDYRCSAGHQYELQQPFGSPTQHKCEKCGKVARRIVTVAPPLVFKAGGYYKSSGRDFTADSARGSDSSSSLASSEGSGSPRASSGKAKAEGGSSKAAPRKSSGGKSPAAKPAE